MSTLWKQLRSDAEQACTNEPLLAASYFATVLSQNSLSQTLSISLSEPLNDALLPGSLLKSLFEKTLTDHPGICDQIEADLNAWCERDPACQSPLTALLYFKGFKALATWRICHALWLESKTDLAEYLHAKISSVYDVDIHPSAELGSGIMLDHATGIVIGATAKIGNNVSILHSVTLGGIGVSDQLRHPHINDGVLIAAGAKLLGPITVGANAKIGSGSIVAIDIPEGATAVGYPVKILKITENRIPAFEMQHGLA